MFCHYINISFSACTSYQSGRATGNATLSARTEGTLHVNVRSYHVLKLAACLPRVSSSSLPCPWSSSQAPNHTCMHAASHTSWWLCYLSSCIVDSSIISRMTCMHINNQLAPTKKLIVFPYLAVPACSLSSPRCKGCIDTVQCMRLGIYSLLVYTFERIYVCTYSFAQLSA